MKNSPDKTAEKIEKNGVYNDNKNPGTTGEEVFTDEEVKILEKELIETYIRSSDSPVKTLFKMYKKYIPEIILSLIFYFLKTLPVMVLPIISGLDGIWWAVAAAEVFAFLISAVFLFVYRKRYRYI